MNIKALQEIKNYLLRLAIKAVITIWSDEEVTTEISKTLRLPRHRSTIPQPPVIERMIRS